MLEDLAVLQHHHPVGHVHGQVGVVGDQQHRDAVGQLGLQQVGEVPPGVRVEPLLGLVQQQEVARAHQRARQQEGLHLSGRECRGQGVGPFREHPAVQHLGDPVGRVGDPVRDRDQQQVLADGQVGVTGDGVADHRDPGPDPGVVLVHRDAVEDHGALAGGVASGRDPEQGRLARPVVSEQRHALPGGQRQVHGVQHLALAVRAADAGQLQQGPAGCGTWFGGVLGHGGGRLSTGCPATVPIRRRAPGRG